MSRFRIPEHWTADEALTVAYFLEDILVAIWDTHGHTMTEALRARTGGTLHATRADEYDEDELDAEIPF